MHQGFLCLRQLLPWRHALSSAVTHETLFSHNCDSAVSKKQIISLRIVYSSISVDVSPEFFLPTQFYISMKAPWPQLDFDCNGQGSMKTCMRQLCTSTESCSPDGIVTVVAPLTLCEITLHASQYEGALMGGHVLITDKDIITSTECDLGSPGL